MMAATHEALTLSRENERRLTAVEEQMQTLQELSRTAAVTESLVANLREDVRSIRRAVDALTEKPARRADAVAAAVLGAIASGAVCTALGMLVR